MSSPPEHSEQIFGSVAPIIFKTRRRDTRSSSDHVSSSRSPSFNEDMLANIHLEEELEAQGLSSSQEKLTRMLSVRSIISTSSSFASRMEAAQTQGVRGIYRSIGAGTCGIVYEELGTINAIKLAKTKDTQLWNDYQFHSSIVEKFHESPITTEELRVPACLWFAHRTDDEWWSLNRKRFLEQSRVVQQMDVLCTERILPLPKELRHAIIDQWCPEYLKDKAKAEPANRDCLVRVYLGKRRLERTRPLTMFQLRIFNLHVDQIQELNMVEYENIARTMGRALGVMHWSIGTDARDVEFVLGSAPTPKDVPVPAKNIAGKEPHSTWKEVTKHNFKRRAICLWLLDFNQCRAMTKDESGVELAVQAFFINDPYYPRPLSNKAAEQNLWKAFKAGYMQASDWALAKAEKHEKALPAMFLNACVAEQQKRLQNQAEAAKRSAANDY
jgi:hypothetical protein